MAAHCPRVRGLHDVQQQRRGEARSSHQETTGY